MEPLFVNEYVDSRDIIKEYYTCIFTKRPWLRLVYVLCAISFAVNGVQIGMAVFQIYRGPIDNNIQMILTILLFGMVMFIIRFLCIRSSTKNRRELNGGQWAKIQISFFSHVFYERNLRLHHESRMELCRVKKFVLTKNLMILKTTTGLDAVLRKDGFTKGTLQEFCVFLNTNGIRCKIVE